MQANGRLLAPQSALTATVSRRRPADRAVASLTLRASCTSAGRYGSATGLTVSTCSGPCTAGGPLLPASWVLIVCIGCCCFQVTTALPDPLRPLKPFAPSYVTFLAFPCCLALTACVMQGSYCVAGVGAPTSCPGGVYGSTTGRSTATCSGSCQAGECMRRVQACWLVSDPRPLPAGYYCPIGSTAATQNICPTVSVGAAAAVGCLRPLLLTALLMFECRARTA